MPKCCRCGDPIYNEYDIYNLCLCDKCHDYNDELVLEKVSKEYLLCKCCKDEAIEAFDKFIEQEVENDS